MEIKRLPEEGVMTHFHLHPDDDHGGAVFTGLPDVPGEFCVAYQRRDSEPLEDAPDSWIEDPFVDFGEQRP